MVSSKNRTTTLFLTLFLGFLGVHRFYVDKTGTGVLYLLTGGLLGIGSLVDLIMIIIGNFKDSEGLPISNWDPTRQSEQMVSSKDRIPTILLTLFFGFWGIHRFYVGKTGTGVLYLLTGGLLGIGSLVDLIMVIVGNFKDSEGLPITKWGPTGQSEQMVSSKDRIATLLLTLSFGFWGIHRFYAGKTGTGVLYLLTGGLLGIGSLVDFIMVIIGNVKDSEGLPITNWE